MTKLKEYIEIHRFSNEELLEKLGIGAGNIESINAESYITTIRIWREEK